MKNLIFKNFKWLLVPLVLLTFSVGSVWGSDLTTADLDFGTPALSETFESVSNVTSRGNTSSVVNTTYSTYGIFTNGYIGKATSIGYDVKAAATPMPSRYLEIKSSTKGAGMSFTRTFATKGAYSITIAKSSVTYVGLYNNTTWLSSGNLDAYTKAKCSVYLKFTGSAVQINSGSGWVDVINSTAFSDLPNVFEVTVIYNNTNASDTYNGGNTTLAAKTAHVFIDGTAIMNAGGTAPKDFTIPGAALGAFRVVDNTATNTTKVDDIKIYDALPDAAETGCSNYSFLFLSISF